jgi:hypothetical protein
MKRTPLRLPAHFHQSSEADFNDLLEIQLKDQGLRLQGTFQCCIFKFSLFPPFPTKNDGRIAAKLFAELFKT